METTLPPLDAILERFLGEYGRLRIVNAGPFGVCVEASFPNHAGASIRVRVRMRDDEKDSDTARRAMHAALQSFQSVDKFDPEIPF